MCINLISDTVSFNKSHYEVNENDRILQVELKLNKSYSTTINVIINTINVETFSNEDGELYIYILFVYIHINIYTYTYIYTYTCIYKSNLKIMILKGE